MKLKKLTLNLGLMAVSTAVTLVLCAFASRLFLNPADYLSVTMGADPAPSFPLSVFSYPSREEPDQSVGPCTFDCRRAEVCVTV